MKKTSFLFMALLGATTLAACTGGPTSEISENKVASSDSNQESGIEDTEAMAEKVNPYVDCINTYSQNVMRAYDRYLSDVDEKTGPTGSKNENIYVDEINGDIEDCVDGVKKAKGLSPKVADLEKAGDDYAAALSTLKPLMTKAHDYYDQKDYKDDNMAEGKAMHAPLIQGWEAFEEANAALHDVVERINEDLDVKQLAALEKEGETLMFLTHKSVYLAKKIVNQGNVDDLSKINVDTFKKAIDDYAAALTALTDYAAAHKEEVDKVTLLDSFIESESKDFLTDAKELMRRVRDKVGFTESEMRSLGNGSSGWMVEGSPAKLLKTYNELIQRSNNLYFR